MNVTIDEVMTDQVMTATAHQTAGHMRGVIREHGVSALPVVDADGTPISTFMSTNVYTVPRYDQPHIAARSCVTITSTMSW